MAAPGEARRVLEAAGHPTTHGPDERSFLVETEQPAEVTRLLGEAGIWLEGLSAQRQDLESCFLELTAADTLGQTMGQTGGAA